jgi:hypothetical protein
MSDSGQPTKTIAILIAIVVITIGLLGAEAWNQSQKGQKPNVSTAAAVQGQQGQEQTTAPVVKPKVKVGQDHGTKDDHGEVMMNE